jgi:hypothetical protein
MQVSLEVPTGNNMDFVEKRYKKRLDVSVSNQSEMFDISEMRFVTEVLIPPITVLNPEIDRAESSSTSGDRSEQETLSATIDTASSGMMVVPSLMEDTAELFHRLPAVVRQLRTDKSKFSLADGVPEKMVHKTLSNIIGTDGSYEMIVPNTVEGNVIGDMGSADMVEDTI